MGAKIDAELPQVQAAISKFELELSEKVTFTSPEALSEEVHKINIQFADLKNELADEFKKIKLKVSPFETDLLGRRNVQESSGVARSSEKVSLDALKETIDEVNRRLK